MSRTRTPPQLSAWRERVDERAHTTYSRLPPFWRTRARRLAYALIPILQCGIGAGLAWFLATDLLGHDRAFFAPIAAIIAMGGAMGKRLSRGIELVVGAMVGIALGSLFISWAGSGPWQIAVTVVVAMLIATIVDGAVILINQAAISAILVATLLPPGSNLSVDRIVDAAVGGLVAVVIMAILPVHPLKRVRRETASLLGVASSVLREVAEGLEHKDSERIAEALEQARTTQSAIDAVSAQAEGGREVVQISPFYRRQRKELEEIEAQLTPLDHGIRNIRVLARRAQIAVEDSVEIHPKLINLIDHLADGLEELARFVARSEGAPDVLEVTRHLRMIAAGLRRELASGGAVTETVVLAQMRSILVDMLQVAGLERISAAATLPPTVERPAITPEPLECDDVEGPEGATS